MNSKDQVYWEIIEFDRGRNTRLIINNYGIVNIAKYIKKYN